MLEGGRTALSEGRDSHGVGLQKKRNSSNCALEARLLSRSFKTSKVDASHKGTEEDNGREGEIKENPSGRTEGNI